MAALCGAWLFLCAASPVPSSPRSREVIDRVSPLLAEELSKKGMQLGAPIYVRIYKESKDLEVWVEKNNGFDLFATYKICTYGIRGLGPKVRKGDGKAPEGFYFVAPASMNPNSRYHLAFNLGYPNAYDRTHKRTGSALMVHGDCVSIGCYAMTNARIEKIYCLAHAAFAGGQPFFRVHIFPFRMTDENMKKYKWSKWRDFWENLKDGYDWFYENGNRPPNVKVLQGVYVFENDLYSR
jgi:murein L,D-transpeptidase YafK